MHPAEGHDAPPKTGALWTSTTAPTTSPSTSASSNRADRTPEETEAVKAFAEWFGSAETQAAWC